MNTGAILRLLTVFLNVFLGEPLFWLLAALVLSGIEEISEVKQGILYVSKKRRLFNAASMIILAIFYFWFYWMYRPGSLRRLISI